MLFLLLQPFLFLLPSNPSPLKTLFKGLQGLKKRKKGDVGVSRPEKKAKSKTDANLSEDALTIEDMVSKAKATESKSKIDSKKDSHQSQT